MDINKKEHANLDAQGKKSTPSAALRLSGNASQKSAGKSKPAKSEKTSRPDQLLDPNTEMVGGPSSPGKRVESELTCFAPEVTPRAPAIAAQERVRPSWPVPSRN